MHYLIVRFIFLLLLLGLSSISQAIVVFSDSFDSESGGSTHNYNSFENFNVSGYIDLVSHGGWGIACYGGSGKCLDMDGSGSVGGKLTTKQQINLAPGIYELSFTISGNQRGGASDRLNVSLGGLFSETFQRSYSSSFQLISRTITVTESSSEYLVFNHQITAGDARGIILDEITLTNIPLPTIIWLFGLGIVLMRLNHKRQLV